MGQIWQTQTLSRSAHPTKRRFVRSQLRALTELQLSLAERQNLSRDQQSPQHFTDLASLEEWLDGSHFWESPTQVISGIFQQLCGRHGDILKEHFCGLIRLNVELFGLKAKHYFWHRPNTARRLGNTISTIKRASGSIVRRGCFSAGGNGKSALSRVRWMEPNAGKSSRRARFRHKRPVFRARTINRGALLFSKHSFHFGANKSFAFSNQNW